MKPRGFSRVAAAFSSYDGDLSLPLGLALGLLFNKLSRFVIAFLPKSKCLLILWLKSPSAVILEPKKIKSVSASPFPLFVMK